jgi:hypothetical protein
MSWNYVSRKVASILFSMGKCPRSRHATISKRRKYAGRNYNDSQIESRAQQYAGHAMQTQFMKDIRLARENNGRSDVDPKN